MVGANPAGESVSRRGRRVPRRLADSPAGLKSAIWQPVRLARFSAHFHGHAEVDAHADIVAPIAQAGIERHQLLEATQDDLVATESAGFRSGMPHQFSAQSLATEAAPHGHVFDVTDLSAAM